MQASLIKFLWNTLASCTWEPGTKLELWTNNIVFINNTTRSRNCTFELNLSFLMTLRTNVDYWTFEDFMILYAAIHMYYVYYHIFTYTPMGELITWTNGINQ